MSFNIGQRVYTIGTTQEGTRGIIDGVVSEVGNNHVWLYISWRLPVFHSRDNGEVFVTYNDALTALNWGEEVRILRLTQHR